MIERWTELPAVVAARWALAQALRQWKYYADEISRVDHRHALGSGSELEDKLYASAAKAAEGLEAAADDSAKSSDEERTRSTAAPGWAALAEYVRREIDEARAARDASARKSLASAAQYFDGKARALDELWNVFDLQKKAPPNDGGELQAPARKPLSEET